MYNVRGGTGARACARRAPADSSCSGVHTTTGAGTEPARYRRAPSDTGPTRVNQCEADCRPCCVYVFRRSVFRERCASVRRRRKKEKKFRISARRYDIGGPSKRTMAGNNVDVKKRYIWSDRETEHFIRLIIEMGMTNMLDGKR